MKRVYFLLCVFFGILFLAADAKFYTDLVIGLFLCASLIHVVNLILIEKEEHKK